MLGEIIKLRFPAPDEESEIQLIEGTPSDESEANDDPNSQDRLSFKESDHPILSPLQADLSFEKRFSFLIQGDTANLASPKYGLN